VNTVTLGGSVLGLGLVVLRLGTWWPGTRALRKNAPEHIRHVLPFLYSWCFGALLIMCSGGVLSWVADAVLWTGNWAGDAALVWGIGGASEHVTRGGAQVLTNGGHAVVLLMCFVLAVLFKRGTVDSRHVWHGVVSGVLLGLCDGLPSRLVVSLASLVNLMGGWNTEVLA
jgi:hypothetical protein